MTTPFIGEVKAFAGNFAPIGYAFCNGAVLAVQSNTALFALIGTYYGGNGSSTFALPDLRGRSPIHQSQGVGLSNYVIGQSSGTENVTLTTPQLPAHTHQLSGGTTPGSTGQTGGTPANNTVFTNSAPGSLWINTATSLIAVAPQSIGVIGGGQPHNNRQPYLALSFIIATQGIFPSRN